MVNVEEVRKQLAALKGEAQEVQEHFGNVILAIDELEDLLKEE